MKKEIFTKEEIKELEQMQERAKAKRLHEENARAEKEARNKNATKREKRKMIITKIMMSLVTNIIGLGCIIRALSLENGLMLLFTICMIMFNNLMLICEN